MLNLINKTIGSLFGNKSERDIKSLTPVVAATAAAWEKINKYSNDALRAESYRFKAQIAETLSEIDSRISEARQRAEQLPVEAIQERVTIYADIDKLEEERNAQLEVVLLEIMPEAFAVIKETARRLKENEELEITATDFDRQLAAEGRSYVRIEGEKAFWKNRWTAGGAELVWDMVHYDVQLIGGSVLHQGKIAEMATGEGKTLVATLPAYLNGLAGQGVHIVTVNDYLARRDSEWMGPLFEFQGLSCDCIDKHQPNSDARRRAYLADITYGTNNEFGFDYLRDNMARAPEDMVQRKHHYAMVDEVDSVLVDDARTPLIISGPVPRGEDQQFHQLKPRIERLVEAQKKYVTSALAEAKRLVNEGKLDDAGLPLFRAYRGLPKSKSIIKFLSEPGMQQLLRKTEHYYMADQNRKMHEADTELYFVIDEKQNSVDLSEKGIELITKQGEDHDFFVLPDVGSAIAEIEKLGDDEETRLTKKDALLADFSEKSERVHTVHQLLKAYTLFEIDVEYIVEGGKVKIVDEQTGRVLDGRRYSDGLHQAIEAKENVTVEAATQTYATVTLQNFFRMYHKLAGMTGTAETEAGELWQIYKLDVVVIPTNKPITRKDDEDLVYKTTREKYNAVIEEIDKCVKAGRPVLVGTTSVEISELLSRMLRLRNIPHNVLNAKQHQREAQIVAEAGQPGQVTIATNMAGRGTDIKLGPGVRQAGGLAIIGTERHESRRVDRQLRGRAGRQGDPGSSQFFVCLEDNLMRLFGSERIAGIMDKLGHKEGDVIQAKMVTRSIERAQKKVEENNFGIRKRLLEYDDVMNQQRKAIYAKRRHALFGDRLAVDIDNTFGDVAHDVIAGMREEGMSFEDARLELIRLFGFDTSIPEAQWSSAKVDDLVMHTYEEMKVHYAQRTERMAETILPLMKDILENQGHQFENIALPITLTANKQMQVVVNLKKGVESEGQEIAREFEKGVVLNLIDDNWKEHLREMDDLKQSVQNAVYEQKDPLLIYKFESFELFNKMRNEVNRETVSTLLRAHIPAPSQEGEPVTQLARKASIPTPSRNIAPSYTSSSTSGGKSAPAPQRKQVASPAAESELPDFMRDALDQTVTSGPGQEAEDRDLAAEAQAKKADSFDKFRKKTKR